MSIELINLKGHYFAISNHGWDWLLRLALAYNWQPLGTQAPDGRVPTWMPFDRRRRWDQGNYYSNQGQKVKAADAKRIARALTQAIEHWPKIGQPLPSSEALSEADTGFFTSEHKRHLRKFILFCEKGSFYIV